MEEERARQETHSPEKVSSSSGAMTVEDELLAQALALSMQEVNNFNWNKDEEMSDALKEAPLDLSSVLGNLPGVNPDDARIKEALEKEKNKKNEKK
jgi:26S proteasome regulatory subunit N10